MIIDSHCHLTYPDVVEKGIDKVLSDARANNVRGILSICCRISEEEGALKSLADTHDNIWISIGTHPHSAGDADELALSKDQIIAACDHPKVIAIGETGLDYHYDFASKEDQFTTFRKQCAAARETGLPVIIHAREADEDIIRILKEEGAETGDLKGVLHCFSSSRWMAEEALDFGFYVSLSGILTFNKAEELRDIAKDVPLNRLLVETDAPYLAPMPYRGKTNQPAYVKHTLEKLADIHGILPEKMAQQTTENFFNLFTKATETWVQDQ